LRSARAELAAIAQMKLAARILTVTRNTAVPLSAPKAPYL
jgi:hypothetical protein